MKVNKIVLLSVLFLLHQAALAQNDSFREDYAYVQVFKNEKWESPMKGNNTIVYNANSNSDVIIYFANGSKKTFRGISGIKKETNKNGVSYQYRSMLDEDGDELQIAFVEGGDTILMYSYGNSKYWEMIKFTNNPY